MSQRQSEPQATRIQDVRSALEAATRHLEATPNRDFIWSCVASAEALSHEPSGLITDIDGTISPIAPSPAEAAVLPALRRHLRRLRPKLSLLAVVTGRPALEARRMVGIESVTYIGNHGLERWERGAVIRHPEIERYLPLLAEARRTLSEELATVPGLAFEDKGVSLSIHYRATPDPAAARHVILVALGQSPWADSLLVSEGKRVVELRPPLAVDKAAAVSSLIHSHHLRGVVYLGDDTSDIDVFRALRQWRGEGAGAALVIGVLGTDSPPEVAEEADVVLRGPAEVERLLWWLAQRLPPERRLHKRRSRPGNDQEVTS